ncbi:hypothetical protein ACFQ0B_45400 [Nonomuraea thailandensis]
MRLRYSSSTITLPTRMTASARCSRRSCTMDSSRPLSPPVVQMSDSLPSCAAWSSTPWAMSA